MSPWKPAQSRAGRVLTLLRARAMVGSSSFSLSSCLDNVARRSLEHLKSSDRDDDLPSSLSRL